MSPVVAVPLTLPLYDPAPADPDGWHAVRSPGGYEAWSFHAQDPATDIQIVATLVEGSDFNPDYLRRYWRYRRRPTRHAPPLPGQYPGASLAVYERGRVPARFETPVRPEEFSASCAQLQVRVGANRIDRDADGTIRLSFADAPGWPAKRGGGRSAEGQLQADLVFRPESGLLSDTVAPRPREYVFPSRDLSGAEHRWVLSNPLCEVEGEIRIQLSGRSTGVGARVISFSGIGYHDHSFGTAPLGEGLKYWARGHVLWDGAMIAFNYARPIEPDLPGELCLVQANARRLRDLLRYQPVGESLSRSDKGLAYPAELVLEDPESGAYGQIKFTAPRVLESAKSHVRLAYDGVAGPRTGIAYCQVEYPRRPAWWRWS